MPLKARAGAQNMTLEDSRLRRRIQHEIVKRQSVNTDYIFVGVTQGIVQLTGHIRPVRSQDMDLREELKIIEDTIRQLPGVRDVINQVKLPI